MFLNLALDMCAVTTVLDYLHGRAVAYRDLKPENLVFDSAGHLKVGVIAHSCLCFSLSLPFRFPGGGLWFCKDCA